MRRHGLLGTGPAVLTLLAVLGLSVCGGGPAATVHPSTTSLRVYRFGVVGSGGKIASTELDSPTRVADIEGTVVQIASSNSDGYALTSSGTVWAWGADGYGELGNGTRSRDVTHAVRVDFPSGVRISSLANPMPFDGGLAIDVDGHAWGWGLNAYGDLCLPGSELVRPARIPLSDVTLATGARTHALFDSDNTVYACGDGQGGVLGTGSTANSATPVKVVGLPTTSKVTALTSSWEGSGALVADGSYYDWGYNAAGQLGDATTTQSAVPEEVHLPAAVRQVSQGGSGATNGQTMAILADGSVWAWGNGSRGQLGQGTRANATSPVKVHVPAGVRFVTVDSGGYACYGIDASGRLWAWGGNQNGQLGVGTTKGVETVPVDVGLHVTQVSSTASNVAALGRG